MLGVIFNLMSKVGTLNVFTDLFDNVKNIVMRGVYGLYFGLIRAIAWILDMLTQLFFIFAGMTPISSTTVSVKDGKAADVDIVNFFLNQKTFQKAYLYLCLVALGLIVVFTIAKIIKQDYFDRTGPRSKGPIFRSVALSFIAFICVIPIFYFLIDVVAALALLVMQAMGYKGGGIGSLIFNMCWDDNGESVRMVAQSIGNVDSVQVGEFIWTGLSEEDFIASKAYDPDNFGWFSSDTFYAYYWNEDEAKRWSRVSDIEMVEFHWHIFIFTGLILIVSLGQMMLAMVTRMFNLIALFIVAPSPISQIVLDDGQKFKGWKDKVIQEALKVVGCVMSFMLFIMIVGVVNEIDLMRYAFTEKAASSLSLIEDNNLTTELSNSISALYYNDAETATKFDKAINCLGRCMIIIAGNGAIKDIDKTITPFISGGSSSMDMGNAGGAIAKAGGMAVKGALDIGKKAAGMVSGAATMAASFAADAGLSLANGLGSGIEAFKDIKGAGGSGKGAGSSDDGASSNSGNDGAEDASGNENAAASAPTEAGAENASQASGADTDAGENANGVNDDNTTPDGNDSDSQSDDSEKANDVDGSNPPADQDKEMDAAKGRDELDSQIEELNKKGNLDEKDKAKLEELQKQRAANKGPNVEQLNAIRAQRKKVGSSKGKLDSAKETLAAAKARDEKRSKLLKEKNAIEKAKGLDPTEKKDRLKSLNDELAALNDKKIPTVQEAQKGVNAAEAALSQDTRKLEELKEQAGDASVEAGVAKEANSNNSQSTGDTETAQEASGDADNAEQGSAGSASSAEQGGASNSDANTSSDDNVRFASIHQQGRIGGVARGIKGALAVTGGVATGATKAAFGITGSALRTTKGIAGTAIKGGASIGGILAKTVLGMTGMGGVASAAEGFVGGVVSNTVKDVKNLGKDIKAKGAKFAKDNMKFKTDKNGNKVDKDGNAINDAGFRVNGDGSVMKDANGDKIKGNGGPVYSTTMGNMLGATGNAFSSLGKSVTNARPITGMFKAASAGVDRISRSRFTVSEPVSQTLDSMERDGYNRINDSTGIVNDSGSTGSEVVEAANNVVSGAEQQLNDAQAYGDLSKNVAETEAVALTVNDNDKRSINFAHQVQDRFGDAESRLNRINNPTMQPHHVVGNTSSDSKKYKNAIAAESGRLEAKYATVIDKYTNKNDRSESTVKAYSDYLEKSKELDDAYLYVEGVQSEGESTFNRMKSQLETSSSFNENRLDENVYKQEIRNRATEMKTFAEDYSGSDDSQMSAATKLSAATERVKNANAEYNRIKDDSSYTDAEKQKALSKVRDSVADVNKYSNDVKKEVGSTRAVVNEASKQNAKVNIGNERYEQARDAARVNVTMAKQNNVSRKKVRKMEERLDALEDVAESSGSKQAYQDRTRGTATKHVTGTRRLKVLAKTAGKAAAKEAKRQGSSLNAQQRAPINPTRSSGGRSNDALEIDLSIIDDEQIQAGIGGSELVELRNAYVDYVNNNITGDEFSNSVSNVNIVDSRFNDEELAKAIKGIKKENIPETHKGWTTTEYKRDAKRRYEDASEKYNLALERATNLSREYANNKNPVTLRGVQEAIENAMRSSEEIRILKAELKIDDKK